LEIKDLRLVSALSSEKTTTRAASALGLTQSAISHQLRSLEERLGVEIFERKGRGLAITEAGERIRELSKDVLAQMLSLEAELTRGNADPTIELRLATQCYTAYHWLPRALKVLEETHPEVRLKLVPEATSSPRASLEKGELDLAFSLENKKDPRFCQKRLFSDELVLVCSKDHALAGRDSVDGSDLESDQLYLYDIPMEQRTMVHRILFPSGQGSFASVTRMPLTEAICELVRANLGVSIMASWSVKALVERGELCTIRIGKKGIQRHWVAAYRRDTELTGPIRTLLRFLKEEGGPGTIS